MRSKRREAQAEVADLTVQLIPVNYAIADDDGRPA